MKTQHVETQNALPYFAYGSNLNAADWQAFCRKNNLTCGDLRPVGRAFALDHRLVFGKHSVGRQGGVADIRPAVGHVVEGALFMLSPEQRAALDIKEGAPNHYEPVEIAVQDETGEVRRALTYRVTAAKRQDHVAPHSSYLRIVSAGLTEHGLSCLTPWTVAARDSKPIPTVKGLFVYGTLREGEVRASLIPADAIRQPASIAGRLVDCGPFPALVQGVGGVVQGEFVAFDGLEALIPQLDRIEGYDPTRPASENLFTRRLVTLAMWDGQLLHAWTYGLSDDPSTYPVIQSGDWLFHKGKGRSADAVIRQHPLPQPDSLDWALQQLAHLRHIVDTKPELLDTVHLMTYGEGVYWRGGEVLVISPEFHGDLGAVRDDVILTRHAPAVTGLFVLCQNIFASSHQAAGLRVLYGLMSDTFRTYRKPFAQQAHEALTLLENLVRELAGRQTEGVEG